MKDHLTPQQSREYMTNLSMRCGMIALCGSLLTLMVSFYGIIDGVIRTVEKLRLNGFVSFTYFTMLSNTLAALSAAFVFPYAVEGIFTKRFILPAWLARMHYRDELTKPYLTGFFNGLSERRQGKAGDP